MRELRRVAGDAEDDVLAGELGRIERAAVELPGHRVQRLDVAGLARGAVG